MIIGYFRTQWRICAERYCQYGRLRAIGINFFLTELSLYRARVTADPPAEIPGIDHAELRREFESVDIKTIPIIPDSSTALLVEIVEYTGPSQFKFRLVPIREATERLHELLVDMWKETRRLDREVEGMAAALGLAQPRDVLLHGRPEIFEFQRFQREMTVIRPISLITHIRVEVGAYNFFNTSDLRVEFTGAWGATRRSWVESGWNPDSWIPLPDQLAFYPTMNHATSKEMKTFHWNVGGIDNPAFLEIFQHFNNMTRAAVILLTETWATTARAQEIFAKIKSDKRLIVADGSDERGGVCLLYDQTLVDVFPLPSSHSQFHCMVIDKRAKLESNTTSANVSA